LVLFAMLACAVPCGAQQVRPAAAGRVQPAAQPAPPRTRKPATPARPTVVRKGLAWIDAGYRPLAPRFSSTVRFTKYAEQGTVTTPYPSNTAMTLAAGGGARVWRDLVVGVAVSWLGSSGKAGVTAKVPHPFFFNTFRDVQGSSPSLARTEVAAHPFVMWMVRLRPRLQLGLFGGPSYFYVSQALVTDVDVYDTYPYDTAAFAAAQTEDRSASRFGFHVGADFAYLLRKQVGLGAMVRYSRASVRFAVTTGQVVTSLAGGLEASGGLRVRF
jgi:hypothetical protein